MNPEEWNNFFVLVGGGSAALTGLVFVAITINLKRVAEDATQMYRAINMLNGFTSAFIISCFALMGHRTYQTLGIEWLVVSVLATVINTNGYIQAYLLGGSSRYALSLVRIVGGSTCYVAQVIGSLMLLFGSGLGIYVAAIGLVANFYILISGSWLLIVGTLHASDDSTPPKERAPTVGQLNRKRT